MSTFYVPTTAEKYWDDAIEGDECISPTYEITGERITAYGELVGDITPLHMDEAAAKASHFGTRVAHGLFGLAIADGLKTRSDYRFLPGISLGWTWDFVLPLKIGDTVHVKFRIAGLRLSRSRPGWGIVVIPSELINQNGQVVQKGEHRLMIARHPDKVGI